MLTAIESVRKIVERGPPAGLDVRVTGPAGGLAVLVFGAGTDYALLLIARYREELHRHEDRHETMELALRRAGPAVLASGATVAIGLLCLIIAELNSTRGLGLWSAPQASSAR